MKLLERKIHLLESLLDGKNIFEANYKAQKLVNKKMRVELQQSN